MTRDLKKACLKRLERLPLRTMYRAGVNLYETINELKREIHKEEILIKQKKCEHKNIDVSEERTVSKEGLYFSSIFECKDCNKVLSKFIEYK